MTPEVALQAAARLKYATSEQDRKVFIEGARFMLQWIAGNQNPDEYSSIINYIQ